jgi:MFS family permease
LTGGLSRLSSSQGVFRIPGFRSFWLATVVNQMGFGMQQVILGWVVLSLTNSSQMVGVAFALRAAPNLVVGFAAGALTDRLDRRHVMRLALFGIALSALVMAWATALERLAIWHVLVYAPVLGLLRAFEMTARQAYVYDLAGPGGALQGLALNAMAQRLGGALGSLIAGAALQWWGIAAGFFIMGLSCAISGGMLYALRERGAAAPTTLEPLLQNLRNYGRALRVNRVLRHLIISTAAAEILGFSHQVMLPVLVKEVLQADAASLGVLTAFRFIGGSFGVMLLAVLGPLSHQGAMLLVALGLFGGGQMLLSQATQLWFAVVCVTWINVMASVTDVLHQILLQAHVANAQRGRAMGSWVVGTGAAPIGHLEIGYLAGVTHVSTALLCNGMALTMLPLLLLWLMPQLRRL